MKKFGIKNNLLNVIQKNKILLLGSTGMLGYNFEKF